jgi:hypothetical protein
VAAGTSLRPSQYPCSWISDPAHGAEALVREGALRRQTGAAGGLELDVAGDALAVGEDGHDQGDRGVGVALHLALRGRGVLALGGVAGLRDRRDAVLTLTARRSPETSAVHRDLDPVILEALLHRRAVVAPPAGLGA